MQRLNCFYGNDVAPTKKPTRTVSKTQFLENVLKISGNLTSLTSKKQILLTSTQKIREVECQVFMSQ